jgi:hypothetical protein
MIRQIVISILSISALLPVPLKAALGESIAEDNLASLSINRNKKSSDSKQREIADDYVFSKAINLQFIGSSITAKFAPQNNQGEKIELSKLAFSLGYDHFNWVSYVENDPHGITNQTGEQLSTPYNDPPRGGYQYDAADELPFYWDMVKCDRCEARHQYQNPDNSQQFELVFKDAPADYRLGSDESMEFITHLVGVKNYDQQTQKAEWEILNTFRWKLTNPTPFVGQVSLVEANIDINRLSPFLLKEMLADGALLATSPKTKFAN